MDRDKLNLIQLFLILIFMIWLLILWVSGMYSLYPEETLAFFRAFGFR